MTERTRGMTLIEVMIALVILALTIVPLLSVNTRVMSQAVATRDERAAAVLLGQKMAELEMDPTLFQGEGSTGSSDFSTLDPLYENYRYDYEVVLENVVTSDKEDPSKEPKRLYRLTVALKWSPDGEKDRQISLTGYVPVAVKKEGP